MLSPSLPSTRTLAIIRRVRDVGFSDHAALPSSCFTRDRIRTASSAMMNSVFRESPSGTSVGGISIDGVLGEQFEPFFEPPLVEQGGLLVEKVLDFLPAGKFDASSCRFPRALQLRFRHQLIPSPPERAHLQFVGDRRMLALHPARDIRPSDFTIGKAALTRFEHLDIVRRGESSGTQEGQKVVEPQR